ncbi:manganese superoxide dismutase [Filobasidium floriforme]|uniref:manganese superoxide dismutase n=1 Tax=Filobasidium floriforme TaxID=5210 RepID=UPI001E8E0482|nr:manganese superoxide dismutase [Filobasidium floriforme]KAH8090971.1 manganese superoxide dismutase [Filobasidium floriforme]
MSFARAITHNSVSRLSTTAARNVVSRAAVMSFRGQHTLPELPYAYDALEPHIIKDIMELHHKKHHQTYITNLNAVESTLSTLQAQPQTPSTVKEIISLQPAVKFNGGGHINHSLFWKNLTPAGSEQAKVVKGGEFERLVERDFGGVEGLKKEVNAKTAAIQGSGWGWVAYNKSNGKLEVVTTKDQDPVLAPHVPIIGIDIWEHAFYLQYKNVKPDYLNAIWNVINFKEAEERVKAAI